jgi:hypothetical protein
MSNEDTRPDQDSTSEPVIDHNWDPGALVGHRDAGWQLSDVDAFINYFHPLVHPDVRSSQPLSPQRVGVEQWDRQFRQIFALLPGVTAMIRSWSATRPHVYVEFDITAPSRQGQFRMTSCDRFTLHDGLITERLVYFDPLPLLRHILCHPVAGPQPSAANRNPYLPKPRETPGVPNRRR